MTLSVTQAEQQLAAATRDAARQKREEARAEIVRLRREGAALLKELRPLAAQVKAAQEERLRLHGLLAQAREQIQIYGAPPDPLGFPSDEDLTQHAEQLVLWQERQQALLRQSTAASQREAVRPQAVALENRINHLRQSIQNLTAIAEGRKPGQLEGGVFAGVEDFLGHTDRRFN